MAGVPFRAQESALLAGPEGEDGGAGRWRLVREGPGQLQHPGHASAVVRRAVADPVAGGVRRANAEGVPVGGEDHRLLRAGGPGALGDDVAAGEPLDLDAVVGREGFCPHRHGPEVAAPGGGPELAEIQAGPPEEVGCRVPLDPALDQGVRLGGIRAGDVIGLGVGRLHRRPAVAGAGRVVDDQHPKRAMAGRLLELVGPAAVVGHGSTAEAAAGVVSHHRLEVGVVDQDDHDLALEVIALEVVPAALRRLDPIAGENQRRGGDTHPLYRPLGHDHDLLALAQWDFAAGCRDSDPGVRLDIEADHRHGLGPAAVVAGRFQPDGAELVDQVGDGLVLAGRAGRASLEGVRGDGLDDIAHPLGADRPGVLGPGAAGENEHESRRQTETHAQPPDSKAAYVRVRQIGTAVIS